MDADKPDDQSVSLRALGWLLCLGGPGALAGVALTMFFALSGVPSRAPHFASLGLWAAAAVASAAGGYLASADDTRWRRAGTTVAGLAFGAGVYLAVLATADHLVDWF
jgi:hypothetical protein